MDFELETRKNLFNKWFKEDRQFMEHVIKKVMAYVECRRVAKK